MDINRLNEFIVLSECLNYSKAANILYITQPVLSRHIHDLEDQLGAQLFVRDTHKVELTEIGRIAADEIRQALDSLNKALKNIKSATESVNGSLRIGFLGHAVKPFLTGFINDFSVLHPNISIYYSAYDLDDLVRALSNDEIEIGFTTHMPLQMDDYNCSLITHEQLCVVVPEGHRLSGREEITMQDIAGEGIIAFSPDKNPVTADFHKQLFMKFGMGMNVIRVIDKVDTAIFYIGLGEGIFMIPRHLSFMAREFPVIPIADKEAYISLNLIWKKNNTKPALQSFIKSFSSYYRELNE